MKAYFWIVLTMLIAPLAVQAQTFEICTDPDESRQHMHGDERSNGCGTR